MERKYTLMYVVLLLAANLWAQDTAVKMETQQILGPEKAADFPSWLADIRRWRSEKLVRMGYKDTDYARPELQWTQRSFVIVEGRCWPGDSREPPRTPSQTLHKQGMHWWQDHPNLRRFGLLKS